MSLRYFFGRGNVYIADRDSNGNAKAISQLIEVPEIEVTPTVEYVENHNTNSAISSRDVRIAHMVDCEVRLVVKDFSAAAMELALFGDSTDESGTGSFSNKTFPSGIVAGDVVPVPDGITNINAVSSFVDSAGTPASLAATTNYTIDKATGLVTFVNVTGFTQPFKMGGSILAGDFSVAILKQRTVEKYLIFDGINLDDGDAKVMAHLFRVSFGPAAKLALKSTGNEVNTIELTGAVLADPYKSDSSANGRYGFIRSH